MEFKRIVPPLKDRADGDENLTYPYISNKPTLARVKGGSCGIHFVQLAQ